MRVRRLGRAGLEIEAGGKRLVIDYVRDLSPLFTGWKPGEGLAAPSGKDTAARQSITITRPTSDPSLRTHHLWRWHHPSEHHPPLVRHQPFDQIHRERLNLRSRHKR
ncbi:hypothetical protein RM550_03640 [Streptomyces sp. DSM 41527]|uniref:Uncharacterized protein n=1 Tax=Streptomyces mooreae TaxID=3075523 RepID=A0ABU2T3I1_9ACTN|nr:hypothetical protein [Streptomyces sp. DSM 41527]MDT0454835.1 hypothetical protein [Streptomyces sp. DSM 41527]